MFDPKSKISNLRGKEYLEVKWRLVWFRDDRKDGAILTDVVSTNPLMVKATVMDGNKVLSTGYGTAQVKASAVWNGREVEKAETAAIGRALAHAGYGTQFTDEEEGDNLADSPVDKVSHHIAESSHKQTIRERYGELYIDAMGYLPAESMTLWNLPENATDAEIIELGKALRAEVEKAKAGK